MSAEGLIARRAADDFGTALERELVLRAAKGDLPFEPSYERLMFKEDPSPESIGSILIPEEFRQRTCRGVILGAGCGARDTMRHHGHLVGDRVLYPKYTGVGFPDGRGNTVLLAPVKDILANYDLSDRLNRGLMEYRLGADDRHHIAWATEGAEAEWTKVMDDRKKKTKEST